MHLSNCNSFTDTCCDDCCWHYQPNHSEMPNKNEQYLPTLSLRVVIWKGLNALSGMPCLVYHTRALINSGLLPRDQVVFPQADAALFSPILQAKTQCSVSWQSWRPELSIWVICETHSQVKILWLEKYKRDLCRCDCVISSKWQLTSRNYADALWQQSVANLPSSKIIAGPFTHFQPMLQWAVHLDLWNMN